jgi:hypothetical protein
VQTDKTKNANEQIIISYLIDKERIAREIEVVDKVHDYFADDRDTELAELIDMRYRKGLPHWKASNGCFVSDRQGLRWLERAYEKAEEIASRFGII